LRAASATASQRAVADRFFASAYANMPNSSIGFELSMD